MDALGKHEERSVKDEIDTEESCQIGRWGSKL